jgi:hypothetical protein
MPNALTQEQVQTIWNQIPESLRHSKEAAPTTSVELLQALRNLVSCQHPEELAHTLSAPDSQDWEISIGQVQDLLDQPAQAPSVINGRSTLFKASDIPRFTNTKEYDDFRSSLLLFLQSTEYPARHEFGMALVRILSTFEDPVARQAAKGWDTRRLIHPTSWEITYNSFIQALDDKFQSATLLQDTKIEWMKCKPKPDEKPSDFFNRFEALTSQLQDVQIRMNAPVLSDVVITERLLLVLPRYLTDDARQTFARTGDMLELKTPRELRKYFEISWTYLPRPAATGHNTKTNYQTANNRNTPITQGRNEVRPRPCGLIVSYDSSPAVPEALRGSLYPDPRNPSNDIGNAARRQRCAQQNVCTYCRRPQAEHQSSGPNFKPVTLDSRIRQTPAVPVIPEERRLTAPPTPA